VSEFEQTGSSSEWAQRAAGFVESTTDTIRDRAIRPLIVVARVLVFGLLILVLSVVLITLASVALFRLLDVYLFSGHVWASWAVLGSLFSLAGLYLWSKRSVAR
jgi:hypothetical protein